MSNGTSTFRSTIDPTVNHLAEEPAFASLQREIAEEWGERGEADLVGAIQRHPQLLHEKSLLLNLAIDEYRATTQQRSHVQLDDFCSRFRPFGQSIERSIFRQLETQQYLDEHPELLEYLSVPEWPEAGDQFGNFLILEELGTGGIARVYLARQLDLGGRVVVVKATPFSANEASILGRLSHSHIVPIHSTGNVDEFELSFLCMPYNGRSTLVDVIDLAFEKGLPRDARSLRQAALRWLPPEERNIALRLDRAHPFRPTYVGAIVRIGKQIAAALEHAHANQILHGDLKPSNVLLTPDGSPLLLDFNLSRDATNPSDLRGGTLSYMPPELLRLVAEIESPPPHDSEFVATTDVYSFGALLYEMLCGVPPFPAPRYSDAPKQTALELLTAIDRRPPSVREHNPLVRRQTEAIVMRCLAPRPEDRPQSMAEVRAALHAESRFNIEVSRIAKAWPKGFALFTGVLLLTTALLVGWLVTRPPQHLAYYQQGVAAIAVGDLTTAAAHLNRSLELQPKSYNAHLELGRVYLKQGELLKASKCLSLASQIRCDGKVCAYYGYYCNMRGDGLGALMWYEEALKKGVESHAIYNNLAAAYLSDGLPRSFAERISRAEIYLKEAERLDDSTTQLHANYVRLHLLKALNNPRYNPIVALPHAERIASSARGDQYLRGILTQLHDLIGERQRLAKGGAAAADYTPFALRLTYHQFVAGKQSISSGSETYPLTTTGELATPRGPLRTRTIYLEPNQLCEIRDGITPPLPNDGIRIAKANAR